MDITTKDIFLLIAGFALSIVATAIWQWWSLRSEKRKKAAADLENSWRSRINHQGFIVRTEAANEIIVRSLYWFVVASVLLAVPGVAELLGPFGGGIIRDIVTGLTSVMALASLASALRWLRLYLKLKEVIAPAQRIEGDSPATGRPNE